jgi:hypothetical protein
LGCFTWVGGGGGYHSDYDFDLGDGCPYVIDAVNFEGSRKFIHFGGNSGAWAGLTLTGSRWASNGALNTIAPPPANEIIYVGYSGTLTMINNLIGEIGHPKPIAFRFDGGGASIPHIMIGNIIGSILSADAMFPGRYPIVNRGNVHWSSSSQTTTKPLDLPIRALTSVAQPSVQVGVVGDGDIATISSGTAITDLLNGFEGQTLTLVATAPRVVKHSPPDIILDGAHDFAMAAEDSLTLQRVSSTWLEIARSRQSTRQYFAAANEQLVGPLGTPVPFSNSSSKITVPAGAIKQGDRIQIRAVFQVSGVGTATSYNPNVLWGGGSGTQLFGAGGAVVTMTAGNHAVLQSWIQMRVAGSTPDWDFESTFRAPSGSTGSTLAFGKTSEPTTSDISIIATIRFIGTSTTNDKITLRELSAIIHRQQ